jgi:hypothetical protein
VCNCDHSWADHAQVEVEKRAELSVCCASAAGINRWDLLRRGE